MGVYMTPFTLKDKKMPGNQIGSDENPMMFRKAIVSKESRFRKGFNKDKYQSNYDRIFRKGDSSNGKSTSS
jgi:hypothetical protein